MIQFIIQNLSSKLLLKYVDLIKINLIKTDLITMIYLAAKELIVFLTFICHFKFQRK